MTTMKRTMTAMLAILCTASAALVSCGDDRWEPLTRQR